MHHAVMLARTGSYASAAQALRMTQPALSRSIQSIEADYGVRLFDRGRGGATVTEAGADFVARAELVLLEAQALDDSMRVQREGVAGKVNFGLGPLIASASLEEALPTMLADFPSIEINVTVAGSAALMEQISANQLHFGICAGETIPPGDFDVRQLGRLPLCIMARAGHPLGAGPVTTSAAAAFPLIGGSVGRGAMQQEQEYRPQLACDNYEILRAVTLASDALWVTSPAAASKALAEGRLIRIDCPDLLAHSYEVVLVTRRRRTLPRAAILVRDRLLRVLTLHITDEQR